MVLITLNQKMNNVKKIKKKHHQELRKHPCFQNISDDLICQKNFKVIDGEYRRILANGFLQTLEYSFDEHVPISIRPDDIWLMILKGIANHEKVGKFFGLPQGKEKIVLEVRRTDNPLKAPVEVYEQIFPQFVSLMKQHINDSKKFDLLFPKFSTTRPLDTAVYSIALMETFKQYFAYHNMFMCNIPEIKIEGKKDDWVKIMDLLKALDKCKLDLSWWIKEILPCIQEFVNVFDGKVNKNFWSSIFKRKMNSGGDVITGWIILFLPYYQRNKQSSEMYKLRETFSSVMEGRIWGVSLGSIPSGYSSCQMLWIGDGKRVPCRVYAGSFGPCWDEKKEFIQSAPGWCVLIEQKS